MSCDTYRGEEVDTVVGEHEQKSLIWRGVLNEQGSCLVERVQSEAVVRLIHASHVPRVQLTTQTNVMKTIEITKVVSRK